MFAALCEEQQAADEEFLLQGETLPLPPGGGGHAVPVHLRQHARYLGHANMRRCGGGGGQQVGTTVAM